MEPLLDQLAHHMDSNSMNHVSRGRFSNLALLPLAFLPGLLLIATLKYLNASGWADEYSTLLPFGVLSALCSSWIAFLCDSIIFVNRVETNCWDGSFERLLIFGKRSCNDILATCFYWPSRMKTWPNHSPEPPPIDAGSPHPRFTSRIRRGSVQGSLSDKTNYEAVLHSSGCAGHGSNGCDDLFHASCSLGYFRVCRIVIAHWRDIRLGSVFDAEAKGTKPRLRLKFYVA